MLNDKIEHYEKTKTTLKNTPAQYKGEFEWLKEVDSLALANVQLDLQKAFQSFFKSRFGFPKFKKKGINCRNDFLHKLSFNLIKNHDVIAIEDLNVKGMVKNRRLAKAISDSSWSKFIAMLTYKAGWYGKQLVKIDRWFPSSKTCSGCGHVLAKSELT
ncbi:MAG: RNA-guided endonuclease TnpB family protein [Pseudomonas sp.]|nr:RNA-guided endonuclease TnpB family protein [Pseudomonas sp.]